MIYAFKPSWLIRGITGLTCVLCAGVVWHLVPVLVGSFWSFTGWIVMAVNFGVLLLSFPWFYGVIHKAALADLWAFPLLDGTWDATVTTNWPRVDAMMKAARHDGPAFNAMSDEVPPSTARERVSFEVKITSNLFDIQIRSRISDSRRSWSIFSMPRWRKPDDPEIYYVFEQFESGEVPVTDTKRHLGAARLRYDRTTRTLGGDYWTERKGEAGINTAGTITMKRRPKARPVS